MNEPSIPKKIKVIGKTYTVSENTEMDHWGRCTYGKILISYDPNQHATQLKDTILHEVIHAVEYSMQLDMDEKQVHAMSTGILAVLLDNPKFAEWLIK
jgi:hypothetical protein